MDETKYKRPRSDSGNDNGGSGMFSKKLKKQMPVTPTTTSTYEWDEDQLAFLADKDPTGVILLDSVPGSGKTQLLIEKALEAPMSTLVISHTNAVRAEIAARIRHACDKNGLKYQYSNVGNHNVFTITSSSYSSHNAANENFVVHIATLDSWIYESLDEVSSSLTSFLPVAADDGSGDGSHGDGNDSCSDGDGIERQRQQQQQRRRRGTEHFIPTDYTGRKICLLEDYFRHGIFPQEALLDYDQIAIDEIQDLDHHFYNMMIHIARLTATKSSDSGGGGQQQRRRRLLLAGDPDQNVFARSEYCIIKQLRHDFATEPTLAAAHIYFREYSLRYNHRCPPAHLMFVNAALKPVMCSREIKWPEWKPIGQKPVVVKVCPGTTTAAYERRAAEIVMLIDECVAQHHYALGDVAVLAPTTSVNKLYGILEHKLRTKYSSACVVWMHSGDSNGLDWAGANGKLILSSIHSNKGRTHKVVIACDFTDGFLPRFPNTGGGSVAAAPPPRLIDVESQISQARVALTRATDLLYVVYSDPISRFMAGPDLVERMEPVSIHKVTYYAQYNRLRPYELIKPPPKPWPVYDPADPLKNWCQQQQTMQQQQQPTIRTTLINFIETDMSAAADQIIKTFCPQYNNQEHGTADVQLFSKHIQCNKTNADTADAGEDAAAAAAATAAAAREYFVQENLTTLYGYYAQCLLLHETLGLPLVPRIAAYCSPVYTKQHAVQYFFSRILEDWTMEVTAAAADAATASAASVWFEYPLKCAKTKFVDIYQNHGMEIYNVLQEINRRRRTSSSDDNGGGGYNAMVLPSSFIVLVTANGKRPKDPITQKIVSSVQCYTDTAADSSHHTQQQRQLALWNIAVIMDGMTNGSFYKRPWMSTLLDNPPVPLDSPIYETIRRNCAAIIAHVETPVYDFEVPVCVSVLDTGLKGRIDLILEDGTIVDVKCALPSPPPSSMQQQQQQTMAADDESSSDVVGGGGGITSAALRDAAQLALYATTEPNNIYYRRQRQCTSGDAASEHLDCRCRLCSKKKTIQIWNLHDATIFETTLSNSVQNILKPALAKYLLLPHGNKK